MRYSESSTKSSFLTRPARLLVSRLPLVADNSVTTTRSRISSSRYLSSLDSSVFLTRTWRKSWNIFISKTDKQEIKPMSEDELYLKVPADFKYNLMLWCLAIVNQIKGTRLLLDSECYVYTLRLNFRKAESFGISCDLRILSLQVLQVPLQVVVGWRSCLQIVVNLSDLLE